MRKAEVTPTCFLIAGLLGAWLAHSIEYFRVWGASVFPGAVSRSAHVYMGPTGILLVVVALLGVRACFGLAVRLERRLVELRRALTGSADSVPVEQVRTGLDFTWSTLLGVLWLWQLVLYLAQENLEAHALGRPLPWLGAIGGIHALAPAVHLAVACVVTVTLWLLRRRITHLAAEVRRVSRMLAVRRRRVMTTAWRRTTRSWTPIERWGVQLWGRPPPIAPSL